MLHTDFRRSQEAYQVGRLTHVWPAIFQNEKQVTSLNSVVIVVIKYVGQFKHHSTRISRSCSKDLESLFSDVTIIGIRLVENADQIITKVCWIRIIHYQFCLIV